MKFSNILKRIAAILIPSLRSKHDLSYIMELADPLASFSEKVKWLETLMEWVGSTSKIPHEFDKKTGQLHWVRLKFLFHFLDRNPQWKSATSQIVSTIFNETSSLDLFTRTGLSQEHGLISEMVDRVLRKLLPVPPEEKNLSSLLPQVFRHPHDSLWVSNLPTPIAKKALQLLEHSRDVRFENMRSSIKEALLILSQEIAARGISHDFRVRLNFPTIGSSPFIELRKKVEEVAKTLFSHAKMPHGICEMEIKECRHAIEKIYEALNCDGVSVSLVYDLECQKAALGRIETLLLLSSSIDVNIKVKRICEFLGYLIQESQEEKKIRKLLHNNIRLLSQKIVERAGVTGEHYITRTKVEYQKMLLAGAGGGALTVGTTLFKFQISAAHFPLFFDGLFSGLNYAISFVTMQFVGFTLATKQPAMTAPALAGKLKQLKRAKDSHAFVDEVQRLTRSQFAAALGNIGAAIPVAILLDVLYALVFKEHILSVEEANYVVHSLNPLTTFTIPFAIWTGIILWSSGITTGWVENWVVCRKLPKAISLNPLLISLFGKKRCQRFAEMFLHQIGPMGGSIALGMCLGFTPIVGKFFGIPLDVRHVTLSSVALSVASVSADVPKFALFCGVLGIAIILILNFGISFSLAFNIATRAREVPNRSVWLIVRRAIYEFRKKPLLFFFPGTKS